MRRFFLGTAPVLAVLWLAQAQAAADKSAKQPEVCAGEWPEAGMSASGLDYGKRAGEGSLACSQPASRGGA